MRADERREAILDLLLSQETASIPDLVDRFGVSHMTIRRDLDALADHVSVDRGQAKLSQHSGVEPRYAAKQRVNATLKAQIARYAARHFVDDGDVILMEGGTTVTAMARYLQGRSGLTAVTNGHYTINELARLLPATTVMSTGGVLRDVSFTYVGPAAEEFLSSIHARTLFVSATGFTIGHGFTDPNPLEAQVRRAMVHCAERTVVLLDSTKFGVVSLVTVAPADGVDVIVTDAAAPADDLAQLREAGVDVHVVGQP
ncbi:MAG: DeoR/GlpR family DNA-binding transcription regulator [Propionicimonas sp.]|nr:DeoR/GlpR family DNA-binding transcription regulator [Propionicimonas sp.]MEA5116464.1 DeoR/GlpR family DNA-binding transcription regulator [Propionicimonas sp.]